MPLSTLAFLAKSYLSQLRSASRRGYSGAEWDSADMGSALVAPLSVCGWIAGGTVLRQ